MNEDDLYSLESIRYKAQVLGHESLVDALTLAIESLKVVMGEDERLTEAIGTW